MCVTCDVRCQIEFRYLSEATGKPEYATKVRARPCSARGAVALVQYLSCRVRQCVVHIHGWNWAARRALAGEQGNTGDVATEPPQRALPDLYQVPLALCARVLCVRVCVCVCGVCVCVFVCVCGWGDLILRCSPDSGRPTSSHITFGALGDSFYEYLVKVCGGTAPCVSRMYVCSCARVCMWVRVCVRVCVCVCTRVRVYPNGPIASQCWIQGGRQEAMFRDMCVRPRRAWVRAC
jgi:hypothetical protein